MTDLPDGDPYPNGAPENAALLTDLDEAVRAVLAKHATGDPPAHLIGWALSIYSEAPGGACWRGTYAPAGQPLPFTAGLLMGEAHEYL